jgi:competence protein ComEC
VLALALVLVLLVEPLAPLAPGFWLSFGAVALLMLGLGGRLVEQGLAAGFLQAQPIVCLGLVPVLVASFGNVSLVSLVVNLLAIPLYTLLLVPLILLACVLLPWPGVGSGLLQFAAWLVEASWPILQRPAEWALASWAVATLPPAVWLCLGVGALAALLPLPWVARAAGASMVAISCLWRPLPLLPGELRFALLDVGQGLSAVIETRSHTLVYDAGPAFRSGSDAAALAVLPYLRHRAVRRVDALVLSHDDADHTGGAATLLEQVPVDKVFASGPVSRLEHALLPCDDPRGWTWDGVRFDWLLREKPAGSTDNDRSCVLQVRTGRSTLLLAGDIGREAEGRLLEEGWRGPVDIVVAAHHGSRSSSTERFVEAAAARWVLFATGYRNRWGFPAEEVVRRWQQSGAARVDTASGGAIEFVLRPDREPDPPRLWRIEHPRPWRDP